MNERIDAPAIAGRGHAAEPSPDHSGQGPPKTCPDLASQIKTSDRENAALLLRDAITKSLADQGFTVADGRIASHDVLDKSGIRRLHAEAVRHQIEKSRTSLARYEDRLVRRLASGADLQPKAVDPVLVGVRRRSDDELLFRWAKLHWSIPTSAGYGRRLRFLVLDARNDKLIGIIGLGDPVFSLRSRDGWVQWDHVARRERLAHVLDAFVLGAVPPYAQLLGGKLVAALVTSNEVREAFERRYGSARSLIQDRAYSGLALVTTTSALGRSSLYNRLRYQGRLLFQRTGTTMGSGEFHFANGLYDAVSQFAEQFCTPSAKSPQWGSGFRNRREVVKKTLQAIELSPDLLYHGVRREVYVAPHAVNTSEFLRGDSMTLDFYDTPVASLARYAVDRWMIGRSERNEEYRAFDPDSWRLWIHD